MQDSAVVKGPQGALDCRVECVVVGDRAHHVAGQGLAPGRNLQAVLRVRAALIFLIDR